MRVLVSVAAYASADAIRSFVKSLELEMDRSKHYVNCLIHICSGFRDVREVCVDKFGDARFRLTVQDNVGLSKIWNTTQKWSTIADLMDWDLIIHCNDDLVFGPGSLGILIDGFAASFAEGYALVCVRGSHKEHGQNVGLGYSCFALSPDAYKQVGPFDENYWPAYCEDCDYGYRLKLAGLHEAPNVDVDIAHYGSRSILDPSPRSRRIRQRNTITHGGNMRYYIAKWGGTPGCETFTVPFDGQVNPPFIREDMERMKALEWEMVGKYE